MHGALSRKIMVILYSLREWFFAANTSLISPFVLSDVNLEGKGLLGHIKNTITPDISTTYSDSSKRFAEVYSKSNNDRFSILVFG